MSALIQLKRGMKRRLSVSQINFLLRLYNVPKRGVDLVRARLARRRNVGRGTHIEKSAHFLGWRNIHVGDNCVIAANCWFNVNDRAGDHTAIAIGDHSFIGQRNYFGSAELVEIGPYALTGVDCRFMGADHVISDPFQPYITTGMTRSGRLIVGANCWLGAGVSIVGDVSVGHGCVIGAGSVVTKHISPFSVVVGSPARVIKRFDMRTRSWVSADGFTAEQEAALPEEDAYIETLRTNAPHLRMPVPAAGKSRGDLP